MEVKNLERLENFILNDVKKKSVEKDIKTYFNGYTILITGAGGSIGLELVKTLLLNTEARLILVDNCEYNIYTLNSTLQNLGSKDVLEKRIAVYLKDIRDKSGMEYIINKEKPHFIFHAAALKHVNIVERNKEEAVKTNIIGSYQLMDLANLANVKKFVFISSDKAVEPLSFMGKTKRVCELLASYFSSKSKTKYVSVRFGNVIGSSGSVIPIFKKQIESGGPITVRHKDATRYFMTIKEAVYLVLSSVMKDSNEDLFILKMGEPLSIYAIANAMKKLYDKEDIEIVFTGLEEGEKLEEKLMYSYEEKDCNEYENYFGHKINMNFFKDKIEHFINYLKNLNNIKIEENIKNIENEIDKLIGVNNGIEDRVSKD